MQVNSSLLAHAAQPYNFVGRGTGNVKAENTEKNNKTNEDSAVIQLSPQSQYEKMMENIREQIQRVNENEHYDAETKETKIAELEKQLQELEKAKAELAGESMWSKPQKTKETESESPSPELYKTKTSEDGDTLDISLNAKAMMQAGQALNDLKGAYSLKVQAEGSAGVLQSEIKLDRGREIDPVRKEAQLEKIEKAVDNASASMGEAVRSLEKTSREISNGAQSTPDVVEEEAAEEEKKAEDLAAPAAVNPSF